MELPRIENKKVNISNRAPRLAIAERDSATVSNKICRF
jgi:hypothetical protein